MRRMTLLRPSMISLTMQSEITENTSLLTASNYQDMVIDAIKTYESHPSILKIKECITVLAPFSFSCVQTDEIILQLKSLDSKKGSLCPQLQAVVVWWPRHEGPTRENRVSKSKSLKKFPNFTFNKSISSKNA